MSWEESINVVYICRYTPLHKSLPKQKGRVNSGKKFVWVQTAIVFSTDSFTNSHTAFSSNFFHGQIAQIYIDHLSGYENEKCSPWNKTPCYFWAGEALEARTQGCLNVTSAQKWHSVIFQISAEKVSWHHIIFFLHLLNESRGFAT